MMNFKSTISFFIIHIFIKCNILKQMIQILYTEIILTNVTDNILQMQSRMEHILTQVIFLQSFL